jgi:hypothetical protein
VWLGLELESGAGATGRTGMISGTFLSAATGVCGLKLGRKADWMQQLAKLRDDARLENVSPCSISGLLVFGPRAGMSSTTDAGPKVVYLQG